MAVNLDLDESKVGVRTDCCACGLIEGQTLVVSDRGNELVVKKLGGVCMLDRASKWHKEP